MATDGAGSKKIIDYVCLSGKNAHSLTDFWVNISIFYF